MLWYTAKNRLLHALVYSKIGFVIYLQELNYLQQQWHYICSLSSYSNRLSWYSLLQGAKLVMKPLRCMSTNSIGC